MKGIVLYKFEHAICLGNRARKLNPMSIDVLSVCLSDNRPQTTLVFILVYAFSNFFAYKLTALAPREVINSAKVKLQVRIPPSSYQVT